MIIFITMKELLTTEEKKYLQKICRYIGSYGSSYGLVTIQMDDFSTQEYIEFSHFDNNYDIEIPEDLANIFNRILKYLTDKNLIPEPEVDYVNYEDLEIQVNCDDNTLSITHNYSYTFLADPSSNVFEGEEVDEIFDELESFDFDSSEVELEYNGSGDSGFLEDQFVGTNIDVTDMISEWCYQELENLHGGWEINEGSEGKFIFNLDTKEITLEHRYNTDETSSNTLWEEKF